jgi:osmoprotectant transport system permease protein
LDLFSWRIFLSLALDTWAYALEHIDELGQATIDHLVLVAIALGIGIIVCIPLGVWTSRSGGAAAVVINGINGVRVIPSLAILFLMVPYFGVGLETAVVALTILAMPPILVNTDAAFRTIDPAVKEAAAGMGMTKRQILLRVEFPLAMPVILTGVRTATTEVIASATWLLLWAAAGWASLCSGGTPCTALQFCLSGRYRWPCSPFLRKFF